MDWLVLDRIVIRLDCDEVPWQIADALGPNAIASIKLAYEVQHT